MVYPKRYAVVESIEPSARAPRVLVARYEDNDVPVRLSLRARLGWGHCGCRGFDFPPGTRIKVFQRPRDRSPHFRRTGS